MVRLGTFISVLILGAALGLAKDNNPTPQRAETVDIEQSIFTSGGVLELKNSFGEVEITGWDQPQLEVVVKKTTYRRYAPEDLDRAIAELDRVVVTTEQLSNDHVVIRSNPPVQRAANNPDVHVSYTIHVPKRTRLLVRHDSGELNIHDVTANMDVTNGTGDIRLTLPDNAHFIVNARSRVGEVRSKVKKHPANGTYADDGAAVHQLRLRVGVGEISVDTEAVQTCSET